MRVAEGKKRKKQIDLRQLSVYLILHPEQAGKSWPRRLTHAKDEPRQNVYSGHVPASLI